MPSLRALSGFRIQKLSLLSAPSNLMRISGFLNLRVNYWISQWSARQFCVCMSGLICSASMVFGGSTFSSLRLDFTSHPCIGTLNFFSFRCRLLLKWFFKLVSCMICVFLVCSEVSALCRQRVQHSMCVCNGFSSGR